MHEQMENIRLKVFTPLDFSANFSFKDYKERHFVAKNSLAEWKQMKFTFSEQGLRDALVVEGGRFEPFNDREKFS